MKSIEHLFIVGAGFSFHAGLPLTTQLTEELLNVQDFSSSGPNRRIVRFLRKFVEDTFDQRVSADAENWPHLEDIFTSVDLAANSGHHLGPDYSPSDLRAIRRALIVRIIRTLRQTYTRGKSEKSTNWNKLENFFARVRVDSCAFLSMNWDTVIEEGLKRTQRVQSFDYRCEARPVAFDSHDKLIQRSTTGAAFQLVKMHGSANWLYCDTCRTTMWVPPENTLRVAAILFKKSDWKILKRVTGDRWLTKAHDPWCCPVCGADSIGTRFATFSYRKALDFPMYEKSWLAAEQLLRQTRTWTFIGYSLPPADYQFKHLLKHVQLSREDRPEILLVTGGRQAGDTLKNFQKFFGPKISTGFFENGLDAAAKSELVKRGALRSFATSSL